MRLEIPAIDVQTAVEWVGQDADGNMGVPSGYDSVAWYERGAKPGETGNSVIAGHLDSVTGPAVFYRLRDLNPGDEVLVTTHDGETIRFLVDRVESVYPDDAPRDEIFGPSTEAHLNLITCDGFFDRSSGQYTQRLVVYTSRVAG